MRTMSRLVVCVGALVLAVAGVRAEDEKVPLDKLPKAVVDAVKAKFPKADLQAAEKEKEDGKTKYEVTIKDGESKIDVDVTEDGIITGYEKEVALKDVPKVVSEAVAAKHPKGTAKSAEVVYTVKDGKDTLAYYEVTVEVDGKTHEVEVLPDGKLKPEVKKEVKK
ncbi:MAG: PepSY-like domain-containing protein [Gemmataceae bacterium]